MKVPSAFSVSVAPEGRTTGAPSAAGEPLSAETDSTSPTSTSVSGPALTPAITSPEKLPEAVTEKPSSTASGASFTPRMVNSTVAVLVAPSVSTMA